MTSIQVYLAGPCFSAAERQWNRDVKNNLEIIPGDFTFYLPQERIEESWARHAIQEELVTGLKKSRVIVANLDGPGGDDGTCWEMGYAAGRNSVNTVSIGNGYYANPSLHKIFWYRTDFRNGGDSEFNVNLMMAYGGTMITLSGTTPLEVAYSIIQALDK